MWLCTSHDPNNCNSEKDVCALAHDTAQVCVQMRAWHQTDETGSRLARRTAGGAFCLLSSSCSGRPLRFSPFLSLPSCLPSFLVSLPGPLSLPPPAPSSVVKLTFTPPSSSSPVLPLLSSPSPIPLRHLHYNDLSVPTHAHPLRQASFPSAPHLPSNFPFRLSNHAHCCCQTSICYSKRNSLYPRRVP